MNKLKAQSSKLKVKTQNVKFLALSFGFALFALHFTLAAAFAQSISSEELIKNASRYDGQTVIFSGEVIGDVMSRGNYAWLNVNDGRNAIGIWAPKAALQDIKWSGSFKSIGDEVEVAGVFHRACLEHGGDLDIHALIVRKTASGRAIKDNINLSKRNQVLILAGVVLFIWILTLLKRR